MMSNKTISMRIFFLSCLLPLSCGVTMAQTLTQKLQKAFQQFESDVQLKHAISSLYVIDANTGQIVFGKNIKVGLAPASTQKVITAATAFEMLGKNYRYRTELRQAATETYIVGYGDPSLGSPRFDKNGHRFFNKIIEVLKANNIKLSNIAVSDIWFDKMIPDGWIYQDIANYYGAIACGTNWKENQVDVTFIPGKPGGTAVVDTTVTSGSFWKSYGAKNYVTTGPVGSGDNAYIYFSPYHDGNIIMKGTIPAGVKKFVISGANTMPECSLLYDFYRYCDSNKIDYLSSMGCPVISDFGSISWPGLLYTHYSPTLDSLSYWFLQKSINLYGEAFIKTIAVEKTDDHFTERVKYKVSTNDGIKALKEFWKGKGMDDGELNIFDGSGLSPQNRVTTHIQVEILKYARKQAWFADFYKGFPDYNNMKMKSGTIQNVKGFTGYHKANNGKEYLFSFLVNNYNGPSSSLVNKMYKVLDLLK